MYTVQAPIPEVLTHVIDPIAEQVLRQYLMLMGMQETIGNNIYIHSDRETTSTSLDDDKNRSVNHNRMDCTVEVDFNPQGDLFPNYNKRVDTGHKIPRPQRYSQFPTFGDQRIDVNAVTMEIPCQVTLNCEFTLLNSELAYELPKRQFHLFAMGSAFMVSDVMYDFPIPELIQHYIQSFYEHMEGESGFDSLMKYWYVGSNRGIVAAQNKENADHKELVCQKTITELLVKVEHNNTTISVEKEAKLSTKYKYGATIKIEFNSPSLMLLMFPVIIRNKLIDYSLIPGEGTALRPPRMLMHPVIAINDYMRYSTAYSLTQMLRFWSDDTILGLAQFLPLMPGNKPIWPKPTTPVEDPFALPDWLIDVLNKPNLGYSLDDSRFNAFFRLLIHMWLHDLMENAIRVPEYDNWRLPITTPYANQYNLLASALFPANLGSPTSQISIWDDLKPAWYLTDEVCNHIITNRDTIVFPGELLYLLIYKNDSLVDPASIHISLEGLITIPTGDAFDAHRIVLLDKIKETEYGTIPQARVFIIDIIAYRRATAESEHGKII